MIVVEVDIVAIINLVEEVKERENILYLNLEHIMKVAISKQKWQR